ncbi:MAG: peptidoglycan editing factor PgeF [Clostridiaceae bacterium]|nr:peptidoglycan editing factor PgeF [Clostridiaceae bacterium]
MNIGFRHNTIGGVEYLTIPSFEETGLVTHGFSTRLGGVSTGEYRTLNLGLNKKDKRENVLYNFKILTEKLKIDYHDLVFSNQVHEDRIIEVSQKDKGKGIFVESDIIGVDGLITSERGVPLVTFYADCVPLFFLDPVKKVIALTHSGWRGTVKKIGYKTVRKMEKAYSCKPKDILVGIGPSIGKCHFEVDKPVAEEFYNAFGENARELIEPKPGNKYNIDLWRANELQLEQAGIRNENITVAYECTVCKKDIYFSHRGDKGKTGSMAAIMQLL